MESLEDDIMKKAQERAHTQAGEVLQNQRLVRGRSNSVVTVMYVHVHVHVQCNLRGAIYLCDIM